MTWLCQFESRRRSGIEREKVQTNQRGKGIIKFCFCANISESVTNLCDKGFVQVFFTFCFFFFVFLGNLTLRYDGGFHMTWDATGWDVNVAVSLLRN